MTKQEINIEGMTCTSCELLIERKLKHIPGVEHADVNRAKKRAVIAANREISLEEVQDALKDTEYKASFELQEINPTSLPKRRYFEILGMVVLIIALYLLLQQFNLVPNSFGITDNMSYGFIFILGLIAATSTCLAVAGGLLLAISHKWNEQNPHLSGKKKMVPHIYFNVGRILSYTFLGGAIGLLGGVFTLSPRASGVIAIIASILMIIIGLQLLHIFPFLDKLRIKMPKFVGHRLYDASHNSETKTSKTKTMLFGASTFFLPCGFTQALQLYVLSQGDFWTGAFTMLAFSLGTLPSLLGVGALSSLSKGSFKRYFMTFSAVLVIALGVFNVPNGFALMGAGGTVAVDPSVPAAFGITSENNLQIIEMSVVGLDYLPAEFTLKQGIPVEWRIDGSAAQGCAQVIAIPKLGITKRLTTSGITTLQFTPQETGNIRFTCGMGMAGPGTFRVVG